MAKSEKSAGHVPIPKLGGTERDVAQTPPSQRDGQVANNRPAAPPKDKR